MYIKAVTPLNTMLQRAGSIRVRGVLQATASSIRHSSVVLARHYSASLDADAGGARDAPATAPSPSSPDDGDAPPPTSAEETQHRRSREAEFGRKHFGTSIPATVIDPSRELTLPIPYTQHLKFAVDRHQYALRTNANRIPFPIPSRKQNRRKRSLNLPSRDTEGRVYMTYRMPYDVEAYVTARMPGAYAAIENVLREVKWRLKGTDGEQLPNGWAPKSVLDFGTGPGTAIWAAHDVWKERVESYTGIDNAVKMLDAAEYFLKHRPDDDRPKHVDFRGYLSFDTNETAKYDLVIASFSLGEVPSAVQCNDIIEALWERTRDVLVIVERGTELGFDIVQAARNHVLNVANSAAESQASEIPAGAHVVAPCPHDGVCPFTESLKETCHFSQRFQRLDYQRRATPNINGSFDDQKYSYVVLRRAARPAPANDAAPDLATQAYSWPRLIREPLKCTGHIIMDVCAKEGTLDKMIVPKSQGKQEFYDARKARWGDLFPWRGKTVVPSNVTGTLKCRKKIPVQDDKGEDDKGVDAKEV